VRRAPPGNPCTALRRLPATPSQPSTPAPLDHAGQPCAARLPAPGLPPSHNVPLCPLPLPKNHRKKQSAGGACASLCQRRRSGQGGHAHGGGAGRLLAGRHPPAARHRWCARPPGWLPRPSPHAAP
jgi:hypothetical protein